MLENIPAELREFRQWVVWKKGHGKNSKRPFNARTGNPASVDDPATWADYDDARQAVAKERADGVGFVLTEEDPFTFIDLDNVIARGRSSPGPRNLSSAFPASPK